jgi:hypothetical protein
MIKVDIDEASAFDMLAILEIKRVKGGEQAENNYTSLATTIKEHLGEALFGRILRSKDYVNLVMANSLVFSYVDLLNNDNNVLPALDVHKANMARFRFKKYLQERFFDKELTEQKI